MRTSIRPIDSAAQGLSKTPLIIVIGHLEREDKISADNGNGSSDKLMVDDDDF